MLLKYTEFTFDIDENIFRKEKNAGNQHFFPFLTMFSNPLFPNVIKNSGLCGKGLSQLWNGRGSRVHKSYM